MDSRLAAFNANLYNIEYFSTGDFSAFKTFCDIQFLGTAIFGKKKIYNIQKKCSKTGQNDCRADVRIVDTQSLYLLQ